MMMTLMQDSYKAAWFYKLKWPLVKWAKKNYLQALIPIHSNTRNLNVVSEQAYFNTNRAIQKQSHPVIWEHVTDSVHQD